MPEVRIAAQLRTEFGKGPARRERRGGRVPAVLYGHGADTRHLSLPGHDVMMALKTRNVLIRLDGLPGAKPLVLPKAVQRDPVKGFIEHVDLIAVRRGEKVTVEVAVQVSGDLIPGGMLSQQLVQVPLEVEATHIPEAVEVDISGLDVGAMVHASDLALPPGAALAGEPDALVVHVAAAPTAEQIAAEVGEEAPPGVGPGAGVAAPEAAAEAAPEQPAD